MTVHNHAIAYFPISIETARLKGKEVYSFVITGLPCLYQKEEYFYPIMDALTYILQELSFLNEINGLAFRIIAPKNDEFITRIIHTHRFLKHGIKHELDDDMNCHFFVFSIDIHPKHEDKKVTNTFTVETDDHAPEKIVKIASDAIQKKLQLPELNTKEAHKKTSTKNLKEKQKKHNKKLKKEQKRLEPDPYNDESLYI